MTTGISTIDPVLKPIITKLAQLLDVVLGTPTDRQPLTYDSATGKWKPRTLTAADVGAAPLASPTFTGTVKGPSFVAAWVTLSDASSIATDCSTGSNFEVTLGGSRTLANPTNPQDGQILRWRLIQDATGNRVLTLGTLFRLGTDVSSVTLSTAANKTDYLTAVYRSSTGKFDVTGFLRGF